MMKRITHLPSLALCLGLALFGLVPWTWAISGWIVWGWCLWPAHLSDWERNQ